MHCTYPLAPGLTRLLVKPNQPAPLSYVYRAVKGVNTNESDWHAAATAVQLSSVTSESRWEVNDVADGYCAFKCACLRLMVVKVLVFADWQNECKTSMSIIVLQWRSIFRDLSYKQQRRPLRSLEIQPRVPKNIRSGTWLAVSLIVASRSRFSISDAVRLGWKAIIPRYHACTQQAETLGGGGHRH